MSLINRLKQGITIAGLAGLLGIAYGCKAGSGPDKPPVTDHTPVWTSYTDNIIVEELDTVEVIAERAYEPDTPNKVVQAPGLTTITLEVYDAWPDDLLIQDTPGTSYGWTYNIITQKFTRQFSASEGGQSYEVSFDANDCVYPVVTQAISMYVNDTYP